MAEDLRSAPKDSPLPPRLSWPVFFRTGVGLVSAAVLVSNRHSHAEGADLLLGVIVVLVVMLPAIGIVFSQQWAVFEAIVLDCTLGAFVLGLSAGAFSGTHPIGARDLLMNAALVATGIGFVAECLYLLVKRRASDAAILCYLVVAALFASIGWMLGVPFCG